MGVIALLASQTVNLDEVGDRIDTATVRASRVAGSSLLAISQSQQISKNPEATN